MTELTAPLPALASVRDLEVRLRRTFDTDPEIAQAEAVLDEASELVRAESGWDWATVPVPRIVCTITLRVAERKMRNPDGYSAESASDYSHQRPKLGPDGSSFLSPGEVKRLRQVAGLLGVWTQPLTRSEGCPVDEGA